jgi:hypothetical protein
MMTAIGGGVLVKTAFPGMFMVCLLVGQMAFASSLEATRRLDQTIRTQRSCDHASPEMNPVAVAD